MNRVAVICVVLCSTSTTPVIWAQDCKQCDCIHLPCPKDCKPCCGFKMGTITSKTGDLIEMDGKKYKIGGDTKISGELKEGSHVKLYFRKSGFGNEATKIIAEQPKTGANGPN